MRILLIVCVWMGLLAMESTQALVVSSSDWNATRGTLQRYVYHHRVWHRVGAPLPITLGRNGMAWGRGVHTLPPSAHVIKREGDGRSPAGIFALGSAFGYEKLSIAYPYHVSRPTEQCVDDSTSVHYNRIVDRAQLERIDYNSSEEMVQSRDVYRYGIVVHHNTPPTPMGGSCIFIHISDHATAGCTAMSEDAMVMILRWLDPDQHPILIQAPQEQIQGLLRSIQ